ncbi:MAG: hypothetical protein HOV81_45920 [Kofleriaceae bacterium]|nr:hypothetical protein [Kofleriaceae bacterium]
MSSKSGCPSASCGTNSAVINGFPFNGLNTAGCVNADSEALIPSSFKPWKDRCNQDGLHLAVSTKDDASELVAEPNGGGTPCQGAELAGASFQVWTPKGKVTLVISHVAKVSIEGTTSERYVYLFTSLEDPKTSVCTSKLSSKAYGATGAIDGVLAADPHSTPVATPFEDKLIDLAEYAVIIPGPVFDQTAKEINGSEAKGWFNIACTGDALGKTEMSGILDTAVTEEKWKNRKTRRGTALRMFSARYDRDLKPATIRGIPFGWSAWGRRSKDWQEAQKLEAKWDENGAMCLDHSRLWMKNRVVPRLELGEKGKKLITTSTPNEHDFIGSILPGKPCGPEPDDTPTTYVIDHVTDPDHPVRQ